MKIEENHSVSEMKAYRSNTITGRSEWCIVSIIGRTDTDPPEYAIVSRKCRRQAGLTDRLFPTFTAAADALRARRT